MVVKAVMSKAIAKAVVEATRIAIKTMVDMQTQRTASQPGPKLGGPALKQPEFLSGRQEIGTWDGRHSI